MWGKNCGRAAQQYCEKKWSKFMGYNKKVLFDKTALLYHIKKCLLGIFADKVAHSWIWEKNNGI